MLVGVPGSCCTSTVLLRLGPGPEPSMASEFLTPTYSRRLHSQTSLPILLLSNLSTLKIDKLIMNKYKYVYILYILQATVPLNE